MLYAYHRRVLGLALMLSITLFTNIAPAQNRQRDQSNDVNRSQASFKFKLRAQITRTGNGYLYNYTLEQVDSGRLSYERLNSFALVFPCGESGYRGVRDLQSDGWSADRDGYFSEPALRGRDSWGLRFSPTFQITPNGDGSTQGERTFHFSFVSDCAPVQGQWLTTSDQTDDRGDVDVPCGCSDRTTQNDPRDRTDRQADRDDRDYSGNRNRDDRDKIDRIDRTDNSNRTNRNDRDRGYSDRDRDQNYPNQNYPDRNRANRNQGTQLQRGQVTVTRQEIIISPSTTLRLQMSSRLTSASAKVGDRFKAVLADDVTADGLRVLPAGCKVEGRVTSVTAAQRGSKSGTIAIDFDRLILPSGRTIKIAGELTSLNSDERQQIDNEGRIEASSTKRKVVFIGGGAAGGAAIGAIAGGGKGAGIGAAVGAGLGVLGVLLTKGQEAVVEPGSEFGLLLTEPMRIPNAGLNNNATTTTTTTSKNNRTHNQSRDIEVRTDRTNQSDRNDRNSDRYNDRDNDRNNDRDNRTPRDSSLDGQSRNSAPTFSDDDYRTIYTDADTIYRAQVRLKELGYLQSAPSSRMNTTIRKILIRYQTDNGLRPTGKVDYPTAITLRIVTSNGRNR